MTKQVSLADSVYQQLVELKENKFESFNSVIQRLIDANKKPKERKA